MNAKQLMLEVSPTPYSDYAADHDQELLHQAHRYVESVVPTADATAHWNSPAWHGWALREAFLAGYRAAQKEQK
jgi:hypothetical protein